MWRALVVVGLCLAACAGPPEVSARLYQTRSDTPLGRIEIQVHNGGSEPVTVERAELRSGRLDGTAIWDRPVTVPAGLAVDLKVQLPEPLCDGVEDDEVLLNVDGRQVAMPAADSLGQLGKYVDGRCFERAVDATAALAVRRVTATGLQVMVAAGAARVGRVGETILFRPVTPGALSARPAQGATVRALDLEPNRCDAHALGEDKQGTYFPVEVTLPDGRTGTYTLTVTARQRADLYRLYADMCGLS